MTVLGVEEFFFLAALLVSDSFLDEGNNVSDTGVLFCDSNLLCLLALCLLVFFVQMVVSELSDDAMESVPLVPLEES